MCYTHTVYFAVCGCYSKPQIYGEPCIRAAKGSGLSTSGCWDTVDYGIDSVDEACRRHQDLGSRTNGTMSISQASIGSESVMTTFFNSRRSSDISTMSTAAPKLEAISADTVRISDRGRASSQLTPYPESASNADIKRITSTSSFGSMSSHSSASSSDHAQSLLSCLPRNIHKVKRNTSGVLLVDKGADSNEEAELAACAQNMHWRAYNSGLYGDTGMA